MSHARMSLVIAVVLGLVASTAQAQLPVPRLNSIFPGGARQGSTAECLISGGDLQGATDLYFSHAGIKAQPAGPNKFKVTVASDVPVGPYDVRVVTPLGLSNFRAFIITDWPEVVEKESNNEFAQAQRVSLPVVVNGRMDGPTDIDHYVFAAKKGERVLINFWAVRIDSQMDGTLMLYDAKGKELAYAGDYYGKDPFLDFTIPEDGDYVLKVWDFVYGGGNDYFYRLQMGTLPHIDAVIPAALRPGEKTTVKIFGRNLPDGKPAGDAQIQGRPLEVITREIEAPADSVGSTSLRGGEALRPAQTSFDGMPFRLQTPAGSSNPIFLGFTRDPIVVEKEPNNTLATAQRVSVPCDITGTFAPAGDLDFYAFTAKKGEKIVVETCGDRMYGLVDPFLVGFDSKGKRLVSIDDTGRNIGQLRFTTNTRDARWDFTPPADGEYFVQVRDSYYQQRGDARFTYRLSIRKPQADFRLVVVPASDTQPDCTVVRRDGQQWMDVLAFRNDGFEEPIYVEADNLPPGVTCAPVVIAEGKASAPLVFHASKDAAIGHAAIRVVGKAQVGGMETVRVARGGGLTWPTVNTPGIARLADSVVLAVRESPPFSLTASPAKATVAAGDKVEFALKIKRANDWSESLQISAFDLPQGAAVGLVTLAKGSSDAKAELTLPKNLRAGTYTFIFQGAGQVPREYAAPVASTQARGANLRVVFPSNAVIVTVTGAKAK